MEPVTTKRNQFNGMAATEYWQQNDQSSVDTWHTSEVALLNFTSSNLHRNNLRTKITKYWVATADRRCDLHYSQWDSYVKHTAVFVKCQQLNRSKGITVSNYRCQLVVIYIYIYMAKSWHPYTAYVGRPEGSAISERGQTPQTLQFWLNKVTLKQDQT